jgi:hypothetical protein
MLTPATARATLIEIECYSRHDDPPIGPRLEATVTYLQHQQHLRYERTQAVLAELFGVQLSEGGQAYIAERPGRAHRVASTLI